jgi:hypothetical protein
MYTKYIIVELYIFTDQVYNMLLGLVQLSLELGESGQPLVPPHPPLVERVQGDLLAHGLVQPRGLRPVSLALLPEDCHVCARQTRRNE